MNKRLIKGIIRGIFQFWLLREFREYFGFKPSLNPKEREGEQKIVDSKLSERMRILNKAMKEDWRLEQFMQGAPPPIDIGQRITNYRMKMERELILKERIETEFRKPCKAAKKLGYAVRENYKDYLSE
ncbi:MAG: hypothetical protein AAB451_00910 [Patescibacteria group bacterium]